MNRYFRRAEIAVSGIVALLFACLAMPGYSQGPGHAHGQMPAKPAGPWLDPSLSPDDRAALVLKELTLDEKITLIHGEGLAGMTPLGSRRGESNGGVGFTAGIPRLGIPGIDMSDAAYGVRSSGENGRYSTALPANVGAAASWDVDTAYEYGKLIGTELRAQGFNMTLGGGTNLTREPRNGRTFEYLGEDPVLAGTLVGHLIQGTQSQHVIGDIKHYAFNDQESGRNSVNIHIDRL
jgi:beta-glucosidase